MERVRSQNRKLLDQTRRLQSEKHEKEFELITVSEENQQIKLQWSILQSQQQQLSQVNESNKVLLQKIAELNA